MTMKQKSSIRRRMADFYFELEGPDGSTEVFDSTDAQEDEEIQEEEDRPPRVRK